MRRAMMVLTMQWALIAPAYAAGPTVVSTLEVELNDWHDGLGDEGTQLATVVAVAATAPDWRLGISTGYVRAEARSDVPDFRGSVTTPLDTVVSASFRGLKTKVAGRSLQFSVDGDLSLPTGKSRLGGRQRNVIFDPLLARYDRYGEGLNYSAGVGAALALTDTLSFALAGRFTRTGKYHPDADSPDVEIDPGDTPAIGGHLVWQRGSDLLSFGVEVADEEVARRNGARLLDRGRSLELSVSAVAGVAPGWTLTGTALYSHRRKDRRLNEVTGELELEQGRLSGDIWAAAASVYRQILPRTELGLEADYASIGDSEIDDADFSYLPARRRWRLGIGMKHRANSRLSLTAAARYVDYRDRGSSLLLPLNAAGVNVTFGVSNAF